MGSLRDSFARELYIGYTFVELRESSKLIIAYHPRTSNPESLLCLTSGDIVSDTEEEFSTRLLYLCYVCT